MPDAEYTDASPKGSVDAGIRDLIDEMNGLDGFVTTSSCAGRVSVFLEGSKKGSGEDATGGDEAQGEGDVRKLAGVGGKGGGGAWLFVSHDPVLLGGQDDPEVRLGLRTRGEEDGTGHGAGIAQGGNDVPHVAAAARLVHFKFEPMILHVLTASPDHAQLLLSCGLQAGFRESGAVSLTAAAGAGEQHASPVVAIRSMGLALESLVGYQTQACSSGGNGRLQCTVSSEYLRTLVRIANERFAENRKRIGRFREAVLEATSAGTSGGKKGDGEEWEDAQVRRERKRAEGLRRKAELRDQQRKGGGNTAATETALDIPLNADFT